MSDEAKVVQQILGAITSTVVPKVKQNGKLVEDFLAKFRATLGPSTPGSGFTVDIIHGGSSYESLTVSDKVDFDITLILGEPFVSENFVIERDPSGFFTLEWKSHVSDQRMKDCDGYLQSSVMRDSLFEALRQCIDRVQLPNATINCHNAASALAVTIKFNTGHKIQVDLVPQITCRTWGQCPDLIPLHEMPVSLRRYIDTLNKNKSPVMCFCAGIPDARKYPNPDQLFNISFSLLEKEFVKSNTELRDMVRMVKVVALKRGWKSKFPFKSFHAKRVAIKYCDQLEGKDKWVGFKALLGYISHEINRGSFDGYFVREQVMYKWKQQEIRDFQAEIAQVLQMNPRSFV